MSGLSILLAVRTVHILGGVLWAGLGIGLGFLFMNSSPEPAKARFLRQSVLRRGLKVIAPAAVLTLLSGMYLFRQLHAGAWMTAERVLAFGAASTVVAMLVGALGNGLAERQLAKVEGMPAKGAPTGHDAARIASLDFRARFSARLTAYLLMLSVIAMAIARFV